MYVDRKNQWVHCFYRLTSFNYHQLSKYGWTMVGLSFKKWVWINASWWKKRSNYGEQERNDRFTCVLHWCRQGFVGSVDAEVQLTPQLIWLDRALLHELLSRGMHHITPKAGGVIHACVVPLGRLPVFHACFYVWTRTCPIESARWLF